MNVARLAGHITVASAGTAVWLIGINMPGAEPNPILYAVAILPWLVAALSWLVAHHVDALEARQRPASFSPRAGNAISAPRRRELTRR